MKDNLPNISLSLGSDPILKDALTSIDRYYIFDTNISSGKHIGSRMLMSIVEDKINLLISDKVPVLFAKVSNAINLNFNSLRVLSELERQFPSYAFSLIISEKELPEVRITNSLKIRISLLTKAFTIFHEERIEHNGIPQRIGASNPYVTHVLSSCSSIADSGNMYFTEVKEILHKALINYNFIGHELLFKRKVNNVISYGTDDQTEENEFSLYSLLFDSDFKGAKIPLIAP